MELVYYHRRLPKDIETLSLIPLSDAHFGAPNFSLRHFNATINYIKEHPSVYCILNGDLLDTALPSSVGDIFAQVDTPQKQRDWMISKLLPIKDKVLAMTTGNHENRIYKVAGFDVSKDIADALGCPYRPEGMLLKISFGGGNSRHPDAPYTYFVHFQHGYGGARTDGAKLTKGQRQSTYVHADAYIMAHDHLSQAEPAVYLIPDQRTTIKNGFEMGKVNAKRKMIIKSAAYLKWGGYGESGGFAPADLTTPIIKFAGSKPDFETGTYPSVRVVV